MEEDKIQMFRDAEAISKLSKPPLKVEVQVYGLTEDNNDVVKEGTATAFLHRLTWLERNHIRASYAQAYKFWMEQGGEPEQAREAVSYVIPRMTVFFALRRDETAGSERFFPSQESIMAYPFDQTLLELYGKYCENFMLSEREWGNFLRARSLQISSALPVTSGPTTPTDGTSRN